MTRLGVAPQESEADQVTANHMDTPTRLRTELFQAIVFDWEGTAVEDRREDASELAASIQALLARGVWMAVVTDADVEHLERQLCQWLNPNGLDHLLLCTNRGSEVYGLDARGRPHRIWLRTATPAEDARLSRIAEALRDEITARSGLDVAIAHDRLNRRTVDLIPLPEWADPPKTRQGELRAAVEDRLAKSGWADGLPRVIQRARLLAKRYGLPDVRITSDVKHVEIGLTDKGDAVAWIERNLLTPRAIAPRTVLVVGDEFGSAAGILGSDDRMRQAIGPEALVVSVGAEPNGVPAGVLRLGGGPRQFRAVLARQVELHETTAAQPAAVEHHPRERGDVLAEILDGPTDPAWTLVQPDYIPALEHEVESRFALSNGLLGIRGSLAWPTNASMPRTMVAGIYDSKETPLGVPALAFAPNPFGLELAIDGTSLAADGPRTRLRSRRLDLRRGVLASDWEHEDERRAVTRLRLLRFASLAKRNVAVMIGRVDLPEASEAALSTRLDPRWATMCVEESASDVTTFTTKDGARRIAIATQTTLEHDGKAAAIADQAASSGGAAWMWRGDDGPATFTHIAAIVRDADGSDIRELAEQAVDHARRAGPRELVEAHVRAWEQRWDASDVVVEGDADAQRALRFALYHLNAAANPEDERVSIGARALTGDGYLGHVFWDTEIFLHPFYTLTWPEAARALLMYRFHTLPGARAKARSMGYRGALYAWESTDTGEETTPPYVVGQDGEVVPVLSGKIEHHISADVAYAVWRYWEATGDEAFLLEAGAEILIETARFWASRVEPGTDGVYHIRGVIGPDEYHEDVDDNAFTNVMAQWNLRCAAGLIELLEQRWPRRWAELSHALGFDSGEREQWLRIADGMYTGFDSTTGLIEQFAGYFGLEQIDLAALEPRTVPVDVLLGAERTRQSQAIKQADVVMLLALLDDLYPEIIQRVNFDYYEPRCGHGSSLSPAIHALVAARLGEIEKAKRYFDEAAAIDLDNTMGNAAAGVHIAAMGGLWQAAVFGFAGMRWSADGLRFDPHLPPDWDALRFPVQWRGRLVRIAVERSPAMFTATLERGEPLRIIAGEASHELTRGETWSCAIDLGDLERRRLR